MSKFKQNNVAVHLLATHCKLSNSFWENLFIHDHTMLSYITAIQPIAEIVKMGYFHTQTLFVLWVVCRNNFNVFTLWIYWYFIFFFYIYLSFSEFLVERGYLPCFNELDVHSSFNLCLNRHIMSSMVILTNWLLLWNLLLRRLQRSLSLTIFMFVMALRKRIYCYFTFYRETMSSQSYTNMKIGKVP